MKGVTLYLLVAAAACCPPDAAKPVAPVAAKPAAEAKDLRLPEEAHLKNVRQLTFGGNNAEAYWAFGGDRLILQSDRQPYKCDQIEILPITGGEPKRVSSGKGRTTCAYFLKGDREIIYASTHEAGPACPTPPDMSKGYVWALFEYDIYKARPDGTGVINLTPNTRGYDAEATVCAKDGSVVFTSTRTGDLELFRMDADGKNVKQLTTAPGYDGGAFFSADCSKIVWRSSRPAGKDLEEYKALLAQNLVKPTRMDLYVANADGTDARQVTYLPGASFAPFFFPDGKRIIFSSNYVNPRSPEFDLFAVNIDGSGLERITYSGGFDGFPVFSPDGKTLSFSSNRRDTVKGPDGKDIYRVTGKPAGDKDTNVFLADWVAAPMPAAAPETESADRFAATVKFLADDAREGRGVGTKGLVEAEELVKESLSALGLEPGVPGWRQELEITTSIKRSDKTALAIDGKPIAVEDFAPIAGSGNGTFSGPIVSVGWGIVDVGTEWQGIDHFKGIDVRGKVALVHRFTPPDMKLEPAQAQRVGDLRQKALAAKSRGAKAMIVIDDGDPKQEESPLPKLEVMSQAGIPVVVVTRKVGAALRTGKHTAKVAVTLEPVKTKTGNMVGVIKAGHAQKLPGVLVVGAHLDHLGMGGHGALDTDHAVHNGADDNASGIAALLEVARTLASKKAELRRDVYIVAFGAEELGILGSTHYVKNPPTKDPIVAMLNLDMVGRMRMNQLHVNGGDSAKEWNDIIAPVCTAQRVDCKIGGSGYGPSDHMPFYVAGVPVVFMFTGSHREYHTAKDDSDKINASGGAKIAAITAEAALIVANRTDKLTYVKVAGQAPITGGDVRRKGASLGTIPSYNEDPNAPRGATISDVRPDGPAAKAGLKGGDRIIAIGTAEVASVADLMFVLESNKPGTETTITYVRDGKTLTAKATFGQPSGRR
ncbi:MAG: M20/M25/M40 family metallo-hydrolase [Kofleriaceae bacterium]